MNRVEETARALATNAEIIRALVQPASDEQARWKPDADTWSLQAVMEHVYNEERVDFRMHLREMFHAPPLPWGEGGETWEKPENCAEALAKFLIERSDSIAWLRSLALPDWDVESRAAFGDQEIVLRAGDVLAAWVAHDYLHIRQMNELWYAWNARQSAPYSVDYAGGW